MQFKPDASSGIPRLGLVDLPLECLKIQNFMNSHIPGYNYKGSLMVKALDTIQVLTGFQQFAKKLQDDGLDKILELTTKESTVQNLMFFLQMPPEGSVFYRYFIFFLWILIFHLFLYSLFLYRSSCKHLRNDWNNF